MAILFTFALGTAAGDLAAERVKPGYQVLHADRLLRFFEGQHGDPRERYRCFVERDEPAAYDVEDVGVFGDVAFAREHVPAEISVAQIPRRFSTRRRAPLEFVLAAAPIEEAVAAAHTQHGYLLKEIGAALGGAPHDGGKVDSGRCTGSDLTPDVHTGSDLTPDVHDTTRD